MQRSPTSAHEQVHVEETQAPAMSLVKLPVTAMPTCQLVTEATLELESPTSAQQPQQNEGANK